MRIDTLNVNLQSENDSSVTFRFQVSARLNADEEAAVKWGLSAKIMDFGNAVPFMKSLEQFVGNPQSPVGKKQGELWSVEFVQSFQRNVIANDGTETGISVYARLVPVTEFNPSPTVSYTFVAQI
jgi:hypothetical protein